ncbi:MAG: T9SS type A sorting domain-containing protein [Flavobacteriales bacterium]|nr:T9SS type A sorting domain-containing protein [Flavobacteriales bacterium]
MYKNLFFAFSYLLFGCAYGQVSEWLQTDDLAPGRLCTDILNNSFAAGQFVGTANIGGQTLNSLGQQDVAVVKRNPAGQVLWVQNWGGTGGDYVYDIEYDHNGHVWVLGIFQGTLTIGSYTLTSLGSNDVFIVKLDAASGAVLYAARAGGAGNDSGLGLEINPAGELYVSGIFVGNFSYGSFNMSGPSYEVFLIKLDNNGTLLWGASIGGPGIESMWTLASDAWDNVYVCGFSTSATVSYAGSSQSMQGHNHFIAKFNGAGQFQWSALSSFSGEVVGASADAQGNLYFTGNFDTQAQFDTIQLTGLGGDDILLGKINAGGAYEWVYNVGGPGNEEGKELRCAPNGDVFVVGNFNVSFPWGTHLLSANGTYRNFVARLNPDGSPDWVIQTDGASNNHLMQSLAMSSDALYVGTVAYGHTTLGGLSATVSVGLVAKIHPEGNRIQGKIYSDLNGNGLWDSTEMALPQVVVWANNNPAFITHSGSNGFYDLPVPQGSHSVALATVPQYYTPTGPSNYTVAFPALGAISSGHDFPLMPQGNVHDLRVDLTALTLPKPGYVLAYLITCQNVGTVAQNASVSLEFSPLVNFLTAAPPFDYFNANTLTWNLGTLNPLASAVMVVQFQVPVSAPLGAPVAATAHGYPQANDNQPADNVSVANLTVVGPYDPNYKEVDKDTLWSVNPPSFLTYTIHFQNVGNAPAHTVLLRDTLSSLLLPQTIQIISSSHQPMDWTLRDGHILEFRFDNIMLPDSASDPIGSCGFVKFRIQHVPTWCLNEVVGNFADIYFDYNLPIRTNTATTVYAQSSVALDAPSYAPGFLMYPNPATLHVMIRDLPESSQSAALHLTDAQGRRVHRMILPAGTTSLVLPCEHFAPGVYWLEYVYDKGAARQRFVIQR